MSSHRAILFDEPGGSLEPRQRQTPIPGPHQVLVKLQACGVNPVDWKVHELGWCVTEWPSTIGCDGAGIVWAVGSEVTRLRVGDRVCTSGWPNNLDTCTFQEFSLTSESLIAKIPKSMSLESAAGIVTASFTAFVSLFHETGAEIPLPPVARAHLPDDSFMDQDYLDATTPTDQSSTSQWPPDLTRFGSCITVLGGSSSVGQFMIQYARIAGFQKILTTASPSNHGYLKDLGATHCFDRSTTVAEIASIASPFTTSAFAPNGQTHQPPNEDYTPLVFDAIGSNSTAMTAVDLLVQLTPIETSRILVTPSVEPDPDIPDCVDYRGIYALVAALWDFSIPYFMAMEEWLKTGEVVPNRITVVGGIEKVKEALAMSKKGVSGVKLIMTMS